METNRNASITVGTDNTKISERVALPNMRKVLMLTNTSSAGQAITLSFGAEAKAGQGVVLYPTGSHSESLDSAFIPSQDEVNAISSAAGGTLAVHERIVT